MEKINQYRQILKDVLSEFTKSRSTNKLRGIKTYSVAITRSFLDHSLQEVEIKKQLSHLSFDK